MATDYLRCEMCRKKFPDPRLIPKAKVIVGRASYLSIAEHKTKVACSSTCAHKYVKLQNAEYSKARTKQKLVYRCNIVWFNVAR